MKYVCKFNLRPRIDGEPVEVAAGQPFDRAVIKTSTFDSMLAEGTIEAVKEDPVALLKQEAKDRFNVELKTRSLKTTREALDKLVEAEEG